MLVYKVWMALFSKAISDLMSQKLYQSAIAIAFATSA